MSKKEKEIMDAWTLVLLFIFFALLPFLIVGLVNISICIGYYFNPDCQVQNSNATICYWCKL